MQVVGTPERHFAKGDPSVSEVARVDELVGFIEATETFLVYREVCGVLFAQAPSDQDKTLRVDLVLSPRPKLLRAGWPHGQIAVECKRAGMELAPAVSQARDYRRALFALRERTDRGPLLRGWAWIPFLFVYEYELPGGSLESLMASDGIGVLHWKQDPNGRRLRFKVGGSRILEIYGDGRLDVNKAPVPGRKVGAR